MENKINTENVAPPLILFDLSWDPETGTSRLIVIKPQERTDDR